MKYYAITGRVCGDDEDTGMVIEADNSDEAVNQFKLEIVASYDETDSDIFINQVFVSDTPIESI